MTGLVSTQPAAFDALLGLLQTAGAAQNPTVTVVDTRVVQYRPAGYVVLDSIEQHEFDSAALGSFAFEETYDLCGCTTYLQGDMDYQGVRDTTFSIHQAVVQATVVANRGQPSGNPVLGPAAPTELLWIIPTWQRYSSQPAQFGTNVHGVRGDLEWRFTVKARITP